MSSKLVKTALPNWEGPLSEEVTNPLLEAFKLGGYSNLDLWQICDTIPGYLDMRIRQPQTSDGYSWFAALIFQVSNGKMVILVPWSQDRANQGGYRYDRSFAIYTQGEIDLKEITEKIHSITIVVTKELTAMHDRQRRLEEAVK